MLSLYFYRRVGPAEHGRDFNSSSHHLWRIEMQHDEMFSPPNGTKFEKTLADSSNFRFVADGKAGSGLNRGSQTSLDAQRALQGYQDERSK